MYSLHTNQGIVSDYNQHYNTHYLINSRYLSIQSVYLFICPCMHVSMSVVSVVSYHTTIERGQDMTPVMIFIKPILLFNQ